MKYFQYVCNYRGIFIYHVNIITKSGSLGVAYSYRTAPSSFLFDVVFLIKLCLFFVFDTITTSHRFLYDSDFPRMEADTIK